MSRHTGMLRAAFQERREQETTDWLKQLRKWRVAVLALVAVTLAAGATAIWQARRADKLRTAAGSVFNTMKALELDVRRLQATTGPDSQIQARQARLEAQYEDLVKTLGIYSSRTPADVQLIYRTIHRLGESEANVPRGFVDEVRKYIKRWNPDDLRASFARARALGLGPERVHHPAPASPPARVLLPRPAGEQARSQGDRPDRPGSESLKVYGSSSRRPPRPTGSSSGRSRGNGRTIPPTSVTTCRRPPPRQRGTSRTSTRPMRKRPDCW